MDIWIASSNKGKISEFKILLQEIKNIEIHLQSEIAGFSPRPETGSTFLENARIKARSLRSVKNTSWVMADDSGLEVEGLNNLPGVHSARYAGDKASDSENVAKLLKMLTIRSPQNRAACFKAQLVVFTPEGDEWLFSGELKGQIATKPSGLMGFGYDPIFIPQGETQSLAELGPGYKNRSSHRALATQAFVKKYFSDYHPSSL